MGKTDNQKFKLPDKIGPYRILDLLGRGGMGFVCRGEDMETGKQAAIKTVPIPNQKQMASIRREIRALARISHPGVVKIIAEGIEGGLPWYAMEFHEGVTLRQYSAEFVWGDSDFSTAWASEEVDLAIWKLDNRSTSSPGGSQISNMIVDADTMDDLEEIPRTKPSFPSENVEYERVPAASGSLMPVLTLINRLCRTLAFLHGEGIIHGDLKPENILVRPDGMPVILDFGLMTQIWSDASREALNADNVTGGTLRYIAPEQIKGELVDGRADLYSLGCILYELVTGHGLFTKYRTSDILPALLHFLIEHPKHY